MSQVNKSPALWLLAILALIAVMWTVASRKTNQADPREQLPESTVATGTVVPEEAIPASASADSGVLRRASPDHDQEDPSQADVVRRRDEAIRKLESAFISEPMDPGWANAQMGNVNAALKPDALAQYGAIAPRNASVDCRSQHCRIVAVYDDMDQAELGQFALASGIGGTLPGTASFMLEQPDGSQRLVIYATAKPSGRPNGH